MKVVIIGWYGTETLGDIAILDGILEVLSEINCTNVSLGSLYPFYTQRTILMENDDFNSKIKIDIFNVKEPTERKLALLHADLLIFGGGPLMNLEELYLMRDCFRISEKLGIPAYVMGCGVCILNKRYMALVHDIFRMSYKIAVRDQISVELSRQMFPDIKGIENLGDPAIISIEKYLYTKEVTKQYVAKDYAVINFREYPEMTYKNDSSLSRKDYQNIVHYMEDRFKRILLVPNMTFSVVYDDRRFLLDIIFDMDNENIEVLQKPISLKELYKLIDGAGACIGMRHHAVVMQTLINGNNIIIDYTEPGVGKTQGFINELNTDFYKDRTIQVQQKGGIKLQEILRHLEDGKSYKYGGGISWHEESLYKLDKVGLFCSAYFARRMAYA